MQLPVVKDELLHGRVLALQLPVVEDEFSHGWRLALQLPTRGPIQMLMNLCHAVWMKPKTEPIIVLSRGTCASGKGRILMWLASGAAAACGQGMLMKLRPAVGQTGQHTKNVVGGGSMDALSRISGCRHC